MKSWKESGQEFKEEFCGQNSESLFGIFFFILFPIGFGIAFLIFASKSKYGGGALIGVSIFLIILGIIMLIVYLINTASNSQDSESQSKQIKFVNNKKSNKDNKDNTYNNSSLNNLIDKKLNEQKLLEKQRDDKIKKDCFDICSYVINNANSIKFYHGCSGISDIKKYNISVFIDSKLITAEHKLLTTHLDKFRIYAHGKLLDNKTKYQYSWLSFYNLEDLFKSYPELAKLAWREVRVSKKDNELFTELCNLLLDNLKEKIKDC